MPPSLQALPGLADLRHRIDTKLIDAVSTPDPRLTEMTSHLVTAGGKRLRPLLVALSSVTPQADGADVLAAVSDDAITGGVAVELAHVGSLHHDDVIDEATTRHNVDSVNARWGNLRAILSGDYLLARGSELAASLGTEIATILAQAIGRLCEGEVRELYTAFQVGRTEDEYFAAIEGKTAALFTSSCRIGGLVAELPADAVDALEAFGHGYGVAFQIVDDILDVVSTDEALGKPAGHDMVEGVYNLPVLAALAGPDGDELRALLGGPLDDDARRKATDLVRASDGVTEATKVATGYVDEAITHLDAVPPGPARTILTSTARNLVASIG